MEKTGLATSIIDFLSALSGFPAYFTILGVLLACGLGVPIPEDITLIAAGILAGTGQISVPGAYVVCFFGVLIGDAFLSFLGRRYGRAVFTWPVFKKLFTPVRVSKAEERIQKNARIICFVARFLPGLRAPIYLTSGVMGVKPSVFLLQDGLAALISVPIWVYLGQWAGENSDLAIKKAKEFHIVILAIVGLFLIGWFIKHKYFTKKA